MQETLFGIKLPEEKEKDYLEMNTLEKMEAHNKRLEKKKFEVRSNPDLPNCFPVVKEMKEKSKIKKPARKRGKITIHLSEYDDNSEENLKNYREKNIPCPKIKGFAVDFEGHNEGSGSPCKDEIEVMKEVEHLRVKHKENYILDVVDERANEQKVRDLVKDKKVIVLVKYHLDSKDERGFFVSDNRSELGIESYLGGADSSGFGGNIGEKEKTLDEKEKEATDWIIKDIMEDGVPRENIEVIKEEMNEEDLVEHERRKAEDRKSDLEYAEKDIKRLSEELKEALKVKYGEGVVLQYGIKN